MDTQTAAQVGKVITTINWEGVILIIAFMVSSLIPVYKWIWSQTKEKKEGKEPLTKVDLETTLASVKTTCLFDKKIFEEIEDRIVENKDMLRDILSQMKTEQTSSARVEDNVERVRKNLADLVESLRKIVR